MLELDRQEMIEVDRKSKKLDQKSSKIELGDLDQISDEDNIEANDPVITFDAFFRVLLKENPSVSPHHKAPMKQYAETNGMESASIKKFYDLFRSY